jgi:hypothetical protein
MNIIKLSLYPRAPIIYHEIYQKHRYNIVYEIKNEYGIRCYKLINDQEDKEDITYEKYAYGILINPFESNILVVDIDTPNNMILDSVVNILMSNEYVQHIDIATSSINKNGIKGRHIYAGLDDVYDIRNFYKQDIQGICSGFCNVISHTDKIVIRTSNKYNNNVIDIKSTITWENGYSKIGDNQWEKFESQQLIVPSTIVDVPFLEEKKTTTHTLNLRRL